MRSIVMRASRGRCGQFLSLLLLSASSANARADQPDSVPVLDSSPERPASAMVKVTWPEIVRLVEKHPRLAVGKFQIEAARGATAAAGAVPNPTVEGTLGQGRTQAGDASRVEWGLTLSMPFDWIVRRGSRIEAAEAEVGVAAAESSELRREILLQLLILFWNLSYEQARVASLEGLVFQTSNLTKAVQRRVEKGEARPIEATRVEIELDKVANELEVARATLASRQATLALWLGATPGQTLVADVDLSELPVVLDRDASLARTRETHPTVLAARARSRALGATLDTEKVARIPSFSLGGFTAHELDRRAYGVGLAIHLPVWNWNAGGIAQAEAKLAASRKQAEATTLQLDMAVIEAQSACQTSAMTATRLAKNMVPHSEAAASTMERTYQLGEASLLEVIDARRTLLEARRLYLNALAQSHLDCSRLSVLVGEEIP
jgi:cobalt-zinc-cadmium efflux system outer membrane protein